MGANLEPLSTKLHDSLRFLYPPLPAWYCASVTRGLPCAWNHTGLSRFELITGWVRCCLYAEGTISMYEVDQVHILPFYLFGQSVSTTFAFAPDDAYNSSHMFTIPPKPAPFELLLPKGNLVPTASYPGSLHTHVSVGSSDGTEGQLES
jgi:hypothetical protein